MKKIREYVEKLNIGNDTCNVESCKFLEEKNKMIKDFEKKYDALVSRIHELESIVAEDKIVITNMIDITAKYDESQSKLEAAQGVIAKLTYDLYGRSSEQSKYMDLLQDPKPKEEPPLDNTQTKTVVSEDEVTTEKKPKKRGGQRGQKGHGRKIPNHLTHIDITWDMKEEECNCSKCGKKKLKKTGFQRESNEIDIKIVINILHHQRIIYESQCDCEGEQPPLVVAKKPNNIINKSMFSTDSWGMMLGMKYLTGIPVNRFNQLFMNADYQIAPSTVIGGFKKLLICMDPLYKEIVKYNQQEKHWHADETRWRVFEENPDKKTHLYWIWVFGSSKSVVYVCDPTRSNTVPENHFKNSTNGIVNVDRYASYNILLDKLSLAYCWYHLRRDFIRVGKAFKSLKGWSLVWLKKIREIEKINDRRVTLFKEDKPYAQEQIVLSMKVATFFVDAQIEMSNPTCLKDDQQKVLTSLLKRREGYSTFVSNPHVPMHNNVAERFLRHVAIARNNYLGSHSKWGGELAAVTWTIFKTAELNGLNPVAYLQYYFQEYAKQGKAPENMENLLPWNLVTETLQQLKKIS